MRKKAAKARKTKKTVRRTRTLKAKGKISRGVIFAIIAVLLVIGGGVFFLNKNNGGASPLAGIVKAPLNPNCELKDPELCKFMNNWVNQRDYSVTSTSNFGGMSVESLMEVSGTDKSHSVTKQNGKEVSNHIAIGDTSYTLDYADNKWWKVILKTAEITDTPEKEMKDEFDIPESKDTSSYKFVVKEACGDLMCFKYELVDTSSTASSKQYLWFDDRDYMIRKMVIEDAENGSMEAVYAYNNINISAPSPVKEGTPEERAASAMGGYNEAEAKKMMEQYQQAGDSSNYNQEAPADTSDDTSESGY